MRFNITSFVLLSVHTHVKTLRNFRFSSVSSSGACSANLETVKPRHSVEFLLNHIANVSSFGIS